jgi:hypothetical protein
MPEFLPPGFVPEQSKRPDSFDDELRDRQRRSVAIILQERWTHMTSTEEQQMLIKALVALLKDSVRKQGEADEKALRAAREHRAQAIAVAPARHY